jgi:hypothetical protein
VLIDQPQDGDKIKPGPYTVGGLKRPDNASVALTIYETKGAQTTTTNVPSAHEPAPGKWDHNMKIQAGYKYQIVAYNGDAIGNVKFHS